MARTRWVLCALALGGLVTVLPAADTKDGDKKGRNTGKPEEASKAKTGKEARGVSDLYLAHSMINYGRKHKSALPLVTAAQMLARIGSQEAKEKPTHDKGGADAGGAKKVTEEDRDPAKLARAVLAEARKMKDYRAAAGAAKAVAAELAEGGRGADVGPRRHVDVINGRTIDSYTVTFKGGETAVVGVVGDGDTDLDLFVYDENGNLIGSDTGPTDRCIVSWVPRWTGPFTIKVVNRGTIANRYVIAHN